MDEEKKKDVKEASQTVVNNVGQDAAPAKSGKTKIIVIGVIAAISVTLADMKVSISQINTQPQKNGDMAINVTIGCKNTSHYESIVNKLRSLRSIISVTRAFSQ